MSCTVLTGSGRLRDEGSNSQERHGNGTGVTNNVGIAIRATYGHLQVNFSESYLNLLLVGVFNELLNEAQLHFQYLEADCVRDKRVSLLFSNIGWGR